jgi:AcrR family transcriptional regulator
MQLTRERIIAAAMELIEREGVDAVSMRRIAAQLDSGVMALYNHVPSKSALLEGVAEQVMSGIDFSLDPDASWGDQVRTLAHAFRQALRAYPRCAMVTVSRPATSAAELRTMEQALTLLRSVGFGEEDAVRVVRMFIGYIVGSLLREVGVAPGLVPQRPLGQDQSVLQADRVVGLDPSEFPLVTGMSAELMQRDHDADFEFGLNLLVHAVSELRLARAK